MAEIELWGTGTNRTFRAHWMLAELKLPYTKIAMHPRNGDTQKPAFSTRNPKQKIPLLTHNDLVISESFAILRYLRTQSDLLQPCAYQASPRGQIRFDELSSFMLMELDATSLYIVRRHVDMAAIYGDAPNAVESAKAYFLRLLVGGLPHLDQQEFVWGSTFSELDILLTSLLDWAVAVGIELPSLYADYQAGHHKRPGYLTAKKANRHTD